MSLEKKNNPVEAPKNAAMKNPPDLNYQIEHNYGQIEIPGAQRREYAAGSSVFSESDIKEIGRIEPYRESAFSIRNNLKYLSGKKRLKAEDDLAFCNQQILDLVDKAIEGIKMSDASEEILGTLKSECADLRRRGRSITAAEYKNLSDPEREEMDKAISSGDEFNNKLRIKLGIENSIVASTIYDKLIGEDLASSNFKEQVEDSEKQSWLAIDYDYFDPTEEMEKITRFEKAGSGDLTLDEKLKIKNERIQEFKKKLSEQRAGITKINAELEQMILVDERVDSEKIYAYLKQGAAEYKLSPVQLRRYEYAVEQMRFQNARVNECEELYKGRDNDFFKDIFGKEPVGKIEIKKGTVTFFIACYDLKDYAWAYSRKEDEVSQENANKTGGFYGKSLGVDSLRRAITVGNATGENPVNLENVRIHEEKHAINELIRPIDRFGQYLKPINFDRRMNKGGACKAVFEAVRRLNEKRAKDEILAYLKEGARIPQSIKYTLLASEEAGGVYDYFAKDRKKYMSPFYNVFSKELRQDALKKSEYKYQENVKKALEDANKLLEIGFSKEKVVGLFQTEHIENWDKVYERFSINNEFKEKISIKIKEKEEILKSFIEDKKAYESDLSKELVRPKVFKKIEELWDKMKFKLKLTDAMTMPKEMIFQRNIESDEMQIKELEKGISKLKDGTFGELDEAPMAVKENLEKLQIKYAPGEYQDSEGNIIVVEYEDDYFLTVKNKAENNPKEYFSASGLSGQIFSEIYDRLNIKEFNERLDEFMRNFKKV